MNKRDYADNNVVSLNATLRELMAALDLSGQGVVFLITADGALEGLLTDGDVRRALLGGARMDDPARRHMNKNFISGTTSRNRNDNARLLNEKIRHLPILDENGRLVEVLRWADLWRLPVMEPVLGGNEARYVADCLASNWISSQGTYVDRFQEAFRSYLQVNYALCVSNGTAALHLALLALGIGPGDEVLVPDLTFVSPASMVLHCGATPVFVDVDPQTWTLAPDAIEERLSPKTKAIIPVHLFGHPCDMDPIMEVARRNRLFVIEDCAEALGAEYKGVKVGTIGDIGTFSFFANKVITTGEGGMVVTGSHDLHERMTLLRDHGMSKSRRYWHQVAGFNYRLTNLQAAIGLAQMEQIERFMACRANVVARYDSRLESLPGITLPPRTPWAKNVFWLYSVLVDEQITGIDRDTLMGKLADYGIDTRPFFCPLHQLPPFLMESGQHYPDTERLAAQGLSLPTSNNISLDDVDRVCSAMQSILRHSAFLDRYRGACEG